MAQSTQTQPELNSISGIDFSLHIGTNYGISTAALVVEALQVHRDTMLDLMFEHIRAGDHKAAYVYHRNHASLTDQLDRLLGEALTVADHNNTAFDYKGNPAGHRRELDRLTMDKSERYERFLNLVLSDSSEDSEAENE